MLVFFSGWINALGSIRLHGHIHAKTSKASQNAKSTELVSWTYDKKDKKDNSKWNKQI